MKSWAEQAHSPQPVNIRINKLGSACSSDLLSEPTPRFHSTHSQNNRYALSARAVIDT